MIYFYADPHFGHANIINLCNRPFSDVKEMNETLIKNYNALVKLDDEVYILGDVAWKDTTSAIRTLKRLNGKKYLITGNHDRKNLKNDRFREQFVWIKDYYEFYYEKHLYVLFHYPIQNWNGMYRKSRLVFGHCHNNLNDDNLLRMDVGVDNPICSFAPISLEKVEGIMKEKQRKLKLNQ